MSEKNTELKSVGSGEKIEVEGPRSEDSEGRVRSSDDS